MHVQQYQNLTLSLHEKQLLARVRYACHFAFGLTDSIHFQSNLNQGLFLMSSVRAFHRLVIQLILFVKVCSLSLGSPDLRKDLSICIIKVHRLCCKAVTGFDKCINHYCIRQNSFITLNIPCAPPIHPFLPLPKPLTPLILYTVYIGLPFLEYQIIKIM